MKCPKCGAWNQAYLTKCRNCGADLPRENSEKPSWEDALHNKKPSLRITTFDEDDDLSAAPDDAFPVDSDSVDRAGLTDEIEELGRRREDGAKRLESLRERARDVRRSFQEAEVIRPVPERSAKSPASTGLKQSARRRETTGEAADGQIYSRPVQAPSTEPKEPKLRYAKDDPDAPVYHDGYAPEGSPSDDAGSAVFMPRRNARMAAQPKSYTQEQAEAKKRNSIRRQILLVLLFFMLLAAFAAGGVLAARFYVTSQGQQIRQDNEAWAECIATTAEDGHPAHEIIVHGKENATVYLQEMASSYVVADGTVALIVPDYMWYDTDSSTYATEWDEDTMDITVSPFIRYTQEGEQYEIEPLHFTIDVPISPVYLLNPSTTRMEVGVSIFEVRLNVLAGSTVIIDGSNVSTLIRETGNVSKNVQVLPVGDNIISISVKSKYYRENNLEVTLYRAPQEIPLELVPTVITEWNYEADDPVNQASISGTTLPGATITVESPHEDLVVDTEEGTFKFKPIFSTLGDNQVVIRASYEGREDSVITHTVYYMPTADVYTRRAWDLNSQYSDLINYISIRKGTIYVGTGVITRIISTAPQMAIMDIGTETFEKLVLLENSSKTTWTVGTTYRIYGEAYGLYGTMPRLTVRYTYYPEE